MEALVRTLTDVSAGAALVRVGWCVIGFLRMFRNHARAAVSNWGWVQVALVPEAYVLGAAALVLWLGPGNAGSGRSFDLVCAFFGATLSVAGLVVFAWTFLAFPTIGTGHYVSEGQTVVSKGPYAWVRHPTYLAVLLLWFGLSVAYRSLPVLFLASCYTWIYFLYARREEDMMSKAFGASYQTYSARVGRFLPRSLRPLRGA